jgi:hypothetical protein
MVSALGNNLNNELLVRFQQRFATDCEVLARPFRLHLLTCQFANSWNNLIDEEKRRDQTIPIPLLQNVGSDGSNNEVASSNQSKLGGAIAMARKRSPTTPSSSTTLSVSSNDDKPRQSKLSDFGVKRQLIDATARAAAIEIDNQRQSDGITNAAKKRKASANNDIDDAPKRRRGRPPKTTSTKKSSKKSGSDDDNDESSNKKSNKSTTKKEKTRGSTKKETKEKGTPTPFGGDKTFTVEEPRIGDYTKGVYSDALANGCCAYCMKKEEFPVSKGQPIENQDMIVTCTKCHIKVHQTEYGGPWPRPKKWLCKVIIILIYCFNYLRTS